VILHSKPASYNKMRSLPTSLSRSASTSFSTATTRPSEPTRRRPGEYLGHDLIVHAKAAAVSNQNFVLSDHDAHLRGRDAVPGYAVQGIGFNTFVNRFPSHPR